MLRCGVGSHQRLWSERCPSFRCLCCVDFSTVCKRWNSLICKLDFGALCIERARQGSLFSVRAVLSQLTPITFQIQIRSSISTNLRPPQSPISSITDFLRSNLSMIEYLILCASSLLILSRSSNIIYLHSEQGITRFS
jgi:hypothetical protein